MTTQSEQTLENNLIAQLSGISYERMAVFSKADILANLKTQLQAHNDTYKNIEFINTTEWR